MSKKKQSHSKSTRENKRAQFSKSAQQKSKTRLVVVLVALAGFAIYLVMSSSGNKPEATTVTSIGQASAGSGGGDIRIPLADMGSQAKFFDYKLSNNKPVRFFVVKSDDGVHRAALDACEICHYAKQGYYQQGDQMVCKKCGRTFPVDLIGEVSTGCHPIGLKGTVEGDHLIINASELESGGRYF